MHRAAQSITAIIAFVAALAFLFSSTTFEAPFKMATNLTTPTELEAVDESTRQGASATWDVLWKEGVARGTRFDTAGSSPALVDLLKQGGLPQGKALVPGCGRGYDAIAFAAFGYHAVGMDLSDTAVKEAQLVAAERQDEVTGTLEFSVGNFFEHQGQYDVIWDLTFLCAINPAAREAWAKQMKALLSPQGVLLTYIFPIVEKEGAYRLKQQVSSLIT
jgi:SAM-dependent methyltransferase